MWAAIDFGISNSDVVAWSGEGEIEPLRHWTRPYAGLPDAAMVVQLLAAGGLDIRQVTHLAVTGGQHRRLPTRIEHCRVKSVNELEAIGRGGQAVASSAVEPILVVSGGSGVAMVAAAADQYRHVTGTGVGGGTLVGLARLLLGTVDPGEIDRLAMNGVANAVDLALHDVVTGPIGHLPVDATAVNFGRVARQATAYAQADMAAALVTLVSQVIGTIAVNAARAAQIERIVMTGHLTDMQSVRAQLARVGDFFGLPIETPHNVGHATAWGALLQLSA